MSPIIFIDGGMRGSCTEASYISALLIVKPILTKYSSRQGSAYNSFEIHDRIGLYLGVLFAWITVSLALYPFTTSILHLRM